MLIILCIAHALIVLWIVINVASWPRLVHTQTHDEPRVSILIPARDEAQTIGRCIASIHAQTWSNWECLVLDDESDDDTAAIVASWADRDDRIRLLRGTPLPDGWVGKCHACAQLAEHARGSWLLFVDADTVHDAAMVSSLLATAQALRADVLTGFPRVLSSHAFGWLVLPLMHFVIALHLPVGRVLRSARAAFVAAHGACMLYRREAYDRIGGHAHEHHRASLIEDMTMAKRAKRVGCRVALVDITPVVACEMYARPRDVWHGFAKNLYNGIGRSPLMLCGLLATYTTLYAVPVAVAGISIVHGQWRDVLFCLLCYAFAVAQKAVVDARFGTPLRWCWAMPVSMTALMLLACHSWYTAIRKKGYSWKRRSYRS
ncbi:MAG: glycosyltransferase [Paenibacillaceae bacterium]|nr:glycosyltransferase [Paenibacillaceae bacterium]